jgi:uncharacterized membrane protein (UPF0182 family)
VLRGDILALPVDNNFLYVESIYIQAESARMPQLRKVVLALGNRLVYEDTFEEALARLSQGGGRVVSTTLTSAPPAPDVTPVPGVVVGAEVRVTDQRMRDLARRVRQMRQQSEELTKELQAIEGELDKQ